MGSEGLCALNGFLIKHHMSFSLINNITCKVYFMYVFPKCILQHCEHKLLTSIVHVWEIVGCLISNQIVVNYLLIQPGVAVGCRLSTHL